MPPLTLDLNVTPEVPIVSRPGNRSPGALLAIAELLAPQARYQRRDVTGDNVDETFCNFFAREALRGLGVDLPRLRANELAEYLHGPVALGHDWAWINVWVAKALAEAGFPVLALQRNPTGPGHVALLMPPRTDPERALNRVWIAQAGATNFAHGRLQQGFSPDRPVLFFGHP